jgi:ribonuclease HI
MECFSYIMPVIECEATTLLIAMNIAAVRGFEHVVYESDNQFVVHVMLSCCINKNELGTIVTSWMSYLSNHASFKLAFIHRQANRAAHNLARTFVF